MANIDKIKRESNLKYVCNKTENKTELNITVPLSLVIKFKKTNLFFKRAKNSSEKENNIRKIANNGNQS